MSIRPVSFRQRINETTGLPEIFCCLCEKTATKATKRHRRSKIRYRWSQDHAKAKHDGSAIYL